MEVELECFDYDLRVSENRIDQERKWQVQAKKMNQTNQTPPPPPTREGCVVEFDSWNRRRSPKFTFQNQIERIHRNLGVKRVTTSLH